MKVRGIDHVAINVKDMAASARFYADVLGLERLKTVPFGEAEITYFAIPGGGRIELFDYKGTSADPKRGETEVGLRHLAFQIEGVAEAERELRKKGVPITLPTTELPELGVPSAIS